MMKKKNTTSPYTYTRVAQQIAQQLAIIVQREVKDPRISIITITDVKITRDLSLAKIYITSLGLNKDNKDESMGTIKILNNMSSFLRTELAQRISMKSIPDLKFYYDNSMEAGNRIEELLDKIKKEES
ncbi:MAG: 30S ribosome-binding factor RbfA [Gammaproteobacteria bacterium]|nr:30S ribosome-binding factor RbfA [Gammaproteobacteria bacterium]